jgi:hypothetical protein
VARPWPRQDGATRWTSPIVPAPRQTNPTMPTGHGLWAIISMSAGPAGRRLVRGRAGTDQPGRAKGPLPVPAALSTRQRTGSQRRGRPYQDHSQDAGARPHPRGGFPSGHAHRRAALAVLCASALIVNTILNVALPTIVRKLAATSSELQ